MKMSTGVFWGIFLIVIGVSYILKVVFDIGVFRIIIACVFILLGIKMLIGKTHHHGGNCQNEKNLFFGERIIGTIPTDGMKYNTVFGKSVYDFTELDSLQSNIDIEINTVFGSTDLILPKNIPVIIKAESAFSAVEMPDGNSIAFGNYNYKNEVEGPFRIKIKINTAFASFKVN